MGNDAQPADRSGSTRQSPRWGQIAALAVILIAATFVRCVHLGDGSLEMDELWSMEMAVGRGSVHDHFIANQIRTDQPDVIGLSGAPPWWHVWTHMDGVTAPPLYPLVLRWWMDCFGQSALAVRSLSVVFSVLGILLLYGICRLLHGPRVALFAAAVAALAGVDVDLAQIARNYSMVIFEWLCCADAIVRIEHFGLSRRRLAAIALAVATMAVTHYLSASAVAALGVYGLIRLSGRNRLAALAAMAAGIVIAAIVWGPWYFQQLHTLPSTNPDYVIDPRGAGHVGRTIARLINAPFVLLVGFRLAWPMPLIYGRLLAIPILLVPLIRLRRRPDLLLWVLALFGTLGFLTAVDLSREWLLLFHFRFFALAGPAVYALLATFDLPSRPFVRRWFPSAALALLALLAIQRITPGLDEWQDISTFAGLLDQTGPDDLLVFYGTDPFSTPGVNYMQLRYYVPNTRRPWLILNSPADLNVLGQIDGRRSLWLIAPADAQDKASQILPGWQIAEVVRTREPVVMQMVRVR